MVTANALIALIESITHEATDNALVAKMYQWLKAPMNRVPLTPNTSVLEPYIAKMCQEFDVESDDPNVELAIDKFLADIETKYVGDADEAVNKLASFSGYSMSEKLTDTQLHRIELSRKNIEALRKKVASLEAKKMSVDGFRKKSLIKNIESLKDQMRLNQADIHKILNK